MPLVSCKTVEIDLAKALGAPSCLGILGKFAAQLLREHLSTVHEFTVCRVDLTSAQVLDYRFVHHALAELVEEQIADPSKPYRLIIRVRSGPQFRNLELGLAWRGPGTARPPDADESAQISDAQRFCIAEIKGQKGVQYLGASEADLVLLGLLNEGVRTAVELQPSLKMGVEHVVAGLDDLIRKGFARKYPEEGGDSRYASIYYLLEAEDEDEH